MAEETFHPKFGSLVKFTFVKKNVNWGQANVDLNYTDSQTSGSIAEIPYNGSIVGLACVASGSASANVIASGSITFKVHHDSTEYALTPVLIIAGTTGCSAMGHADSVTINPGALRVAKMDRVGVSATTSNSGSWTGGLGSACLVADLYVLLDPN
jgi:hypothetical protein